MQKKGLMIGAAIALFLVMSGINAYNGLVKGDERVKQSINAIESQYQRRSDLVPNLVNVVKGSANFEEETLTKVIDARANATKITLDANNMTEENLRKFQETQNQLGASLGRLMAVAENYPELKSTQAFQDLMPQLEGTENRIQTVRSDYGKEVQIFNSKIKSFPTVIFARLFGFKEYPYFKADSSEAPKVDFSK